MKIRSFAAAVCVALLIVLVGCASNAPKPLTPPQIAAIACPQLNLVHTQLAALNTVLEADPATAAVGTKGAADLAKADAIVAAVCNGANAAPTVDATSIQTLIQTGLPALGYLAGSLPLPPNQQAQIQDALVVAETAAGVAGVIEAQIKAAQAAPAAASSTH